MQETLGDSFSKSQMEEAAKRAHYDPEKAVAWLLNDEGNNIPLLQVGSNILIVVLHRSRLGRTL
jgi:hypothetical protein